MFKLDTFNRAQLNLKTILEFPKIVVIELNQNQVPSPKQVKREMNENNKDALIESLKRKVKKLESENKELKEQLKFAYAEVYKEL